MTGVSQQVSRKRGVIAAVAAAGLLLPAAVIRAQGAPSGSHELRMTEVLSGKPFPLELHMKDLAGGDWRRVTAVGKTVTTAPVSTPDALAGRPTYTKGDTVRIDGEAFLIVYTLQSLGTKDVITAQNVFGKPTPDGSLALTLLSLRNTNALAGLAAFDLSNETVTQAEIDRTIIKIRNDNVEVSLRQIGKALRFYIADHGGLPPMESIERVRAAFGPYINRSDNVYTSLTSGKSFLTNPTLSNKLLRDVSNAEHIVAVYDSAPAPDGTRAAAFADGHVERFSEDRWPEIARASGITK